MGVTRIHIDPSLYEEADDALAVAVAFAGTVRIFVLILALPADRV